MELVVPETWRNFLVLLLNSFRNRLEVAIVNGRSGRVRMKGVRYK